MAATFLDELIKLGGVRLSDKFVLTAPKNKTHYLLHESGGCAMRITGATDEQALVSARAFLERQPNPRMDYSGPP